MRLQNLHKILMENRAVNILRKKQDVDLTINQLKILLLLTILGTEINTKKIRNKLDFLRLGMTGGSIRGNLNKLLQCKLVSKQIVKTTKPFAYQGEMHLWQITSEGLLLLNEFEKILRRTRIDK